MNPYNNEQDPRLRAAQLPEQMRARIHIVERGARNGEASADATRPATPPAEMFTPSYPAEPVVAPQEKPALAVISSDAIVQANNLVDQAYKEAA